MKNAALRSSVSWDEVISIAYRQRKLLLIALAAPVFLAILVTIIMPRVYRAESEIVVKTGREYVAQSETEMTPAAPQSTKEEAINSEVELLTSRQTVLAAINSIGLKQLFPDLAACAGQSADGPSFFGCPWRSSVADEAVKRFERNLHVQPIKLSDVISVTYDWSDPRRAEWILDSFIRTYQGIHTQVFSAGDQSAYQATLKGFLARLDGLEQRATQIKVENGIFDTTTQRNALIEQRVETEDKLNDTISRQATLQQSIAYLVGKRAHVSSVLPSGEMEHANSALVDLQQSEVEMAARYGRENPELQRVRQQLRDMRGKMGGVKAEMNRLTATPSPLAQQIDEQLVADRAELAPLQDEIARQQKRLADIREQLSRLEKADLDLRNVQTRIAAMSGTLESLQTRYNRSRSEEELDRARQVSVVPIGRAVAPDKPYLPRPTMFMAAGLLMGVLIAGGILVVGVATNTRIIGERSVERLTGLPVLATISPIAADGLRQLAVRKLE